MIKEQLAEIWGLWKTVVVRESNKLASLALRRFVEDSTEHRIQTQESKFKPGYWLVFRDHLETLKDLGEHNYSYVSRYPQVSSVQRQKPDLAS